MPAYSFKERFVPFVKDGTKTQTIRKRRKIEVAPGQTIYLYYAMRTKHCIKLGETICTKVEPIIINETGKIKIGVIPLSENLKDWFAWKDGFRPEGSTEENPAGAFELMYRWWRSTHGLPFSGEVIHWEQKIRNQWKQLLKR